MPAPVELGEWDYIDIQNKRLYRQTETVIFTGAETWEICEGTAYGEYDAVRIKLSIPDESRRHVVCTHYPSEREVDWDGETWCYTQNGYFQVERPLGKADIDLTAWKTYLTELYNAGKPLTVSYKRETPVVEYIDMTEKYQAYNGGCEAVIQGETDNSEYGALITVTQTYAVIKGGTEQ